MGGGEGEVGRGSRREEWRKEGLARTLKIVDTVIGRVISENVVNYTAGS